MLSLTRRLQREPSAWLLTLALLVIACGSRSGLTERGARLGGGGSDGGGADAGGGVPSSSGGQATHTGGSAAGGHGPATGGRGPSGGGGASGGDGGGGDGAVGADGGAGGSGGSCSGGVCPPLTCGDGELSADEECDDGNQESDDDCTALCRVAFCGDGFLHTSEACDDGNTSDGDECPADCGLEVLRVAAYGEQTCALLTNRRVKCWGNNAYGQLGLGDREQRGDAAGEMGDALPFVDLGSGATAKSLAMGWYHTCALLDGGFVKCWGQNDDGQLGLGDTFGRGDEPGEMGDDLPVVDLGVGRSVLSLGAGVYHSCALLDDGSVKCWGYNGPGQLGLGDRQRRGDESGEMGDELSAVALGSGRTATALAVGTYHTCALLDDGSVKCWGNNDSAQLGLGDVAYRGDEAGEMGDALPPVALGTARTVHALAAGSGFNCALLDDDSLKCWGNNSGGELGQGDTESRGDQPGEMGDALLAVDLGSGHAARIVATGPSHACALRDDDAVKCWGWNLFGQLGIGDQDWRGDDAGEMGDALASVDLGVASLAQGLVAGGYHTCALLEGGRLKCWGQNAFGQLGLGDQDWRGDQAGEMGDALPTIELW